MANFTRYIVVSNPVGTHAERAARYTAQIKRAYPESEVILINTIPGGIPANRTLLMQHREKLGPGSVIGIVGGDGTVNLVVTILLGPGFTNKARQTAVVPLWGGNANDLACTLNGRPPRSVAPLLQRGSSIAVRPLICKLQGTNNQQTYIAVSYASFGASATVARRLRQVIQRDYPAHRIPGVRLLREAGSTRIGLKQAPLFRATLDGHEKHVFEAAFFNGPRFAKVGGLPLRLEEERFFATVVEDGQLPRLVRHAARLRDPRNATSFSRTSFSFTTLDETEGQFDGEIVTVAAGTTIHIALNTQPIQLFGRKSNHAAKADLRI